MYRFNIIITEACNASCTHCYMGNNKCRKTMTKKDIDTIIKNMPTNTESVVLTGGEIFIKKDLLYYTIKSLHQKDPNILIKLESNGIYFINNPDPLKELICLKKIGVESIRFSDDKFHASGGVDLKKVRALKKLESEQTPLIKYLVQDKALAIGKAANLDSKDTKKSNCMNDKHTLDNPYLFLDIKGDVYICTWKCVPPIGNMIKESMSTILDRLDDKFNKLILQGKILEAINLVNKDPNNSLYKKENGECLLCYKTFKKQ